MDRLLLIYERLVSFGNLPFWLVVVLSALVAAIVVYSAGLFIKENPHLYKTAQVATVLILLICPFMECEAFFHDLTNPIGTVICKYLVAFIMLGCMVLMYIWSILIVFCVSIVKCGGLYGKR